MPFLAAPLLVIGTTTITVGMAINFAITVASIAYQQNKAKKMKAQMQAQADKMAAAEEARKGFEVTRNQSVENLPVLYGYNKVAGNITNSLVSPNYTHAEPANYTNSFDPVDGFNYDENNFISYTVIGNVGPPLSTNPNEEDPLLIGNDIINISNLTIQIYWNGSLITEKVTIGSAFENNIVAASFKSIRNSFGFLDGNDGYYYYPADPVKISDTEFRYALRRRAADSGGTTKFSRGLTESVTDTKNEFMFVQAALSFAGISEILEMDIDGTPQGDDKFEYGYNVHIYPQGNIADPLATANGISSTNTFTNTAYYSAAWRLNRDDPQFNGVPSAEFYTKGKLLPIIEYDSQSDTYSISSNKTFSNNAVRVLLDYLTNSLYGRGLLESQIDLKSFYESQQIANTVVFTGASDGKIFGGPSRREFLLYEFNGIINTGKPVRENIELILESMGQSVLVWSGGQYKLSVKYPNQQPSVANGMVDPSFVFNDDDLILSTLDLVYPSAEDKFNQVTVRFPNAFKNFRNDSVSWPDKFSAAYNLFFEEDNNQPLETEVSSYGIIDPYHARAKAEELVRLSRASHSMSCTLSNKASFLEPGDFFILSSAAANIVNQLYRVESIKFLKDNSVQVNAYSFDFRTLAWNVADEVPYAENTLVTKQVLPPRNVNFDKNIDELLGVSSGELTWSESLDPTVRSYIVEVSSNNGTTWDTLGETRTNRFVVPALKTGTYQFRVRSKELLGRLSLPALATDDQANTTHTIQRKTTDQVVAIYHSSEDQDIAPEDQSFEQGLRTHVNYYVYNGDLPTLPILSSTEVISFTRIAPVQVTSLVSPVTSLSILKNPEGVYDASFLDIDFEFRLDNVKSALRRFRITRTNNSWTSISNRDGDSPEELNTTFITATANLLSSNSTIIVNYNDGKYRGSTTASVNILQSGTEGAAGLSTYQASIFRRFSPVWDTQSVSLQKSQLIGFNINGIYFKPDGTKLYLADDSNNEISEYSLSTPWDINTITYIGGYDTAFQDTAPTGVFFKPDGTKFYFSGSLTNKIYEHTLSTPWDLSTASPPPGVSRIVSGESAVSDVFISSDGLKLFTIGISSDTIVEYLLSTPWDISTGTTSGNNLNVSAQELNPRGITFGNSGTALYVIGTSGDDVNYYTLTAPFDLSTAVFVSNTNLVTATSEFNPQGIYFKPDGTGFFTVGTSVDSIHEFTITTVLNAPTGGSYDFTNQVLTPPLNWSSFVPAGDKPLYISNTLASITGITGTDSSLTWSTPTIIAVNGIDGISGISVKLQYSADGLTNWHDSIEVGDFYVRSGTLSPPATEYIYGDAVKIVPEKGVEYDDGTPGTSAYLHIAYADTALGEGFSQLPDGKAYLGSYTDSNPIDSTNPADYTWVKIKGEDGINGEDGVDGTPGVDGVRGAGWWRYENASLINTSGLSTPTINSYFFQSVGLSPVEGDRFIISNVADATGYIYTSIETWLEQAEFIDGNLLVNGTITGNKLVADSISALGLTLGTLSSNPTGERIEISDNRIVVYDENNVIRIIIGDLTGT